MSPSSPPPPAPLATYVDEDGDACTIATAAELEEAWRIADAVSPSPLVLTLVQATGAAATTAPALPFRWLPAIATGTGTGTTVAAAGAGAAAAPPVDEHAAFRLSFTTAASNTAVTIRHTGVSWYNVYVDGALVAEGPTRFMGATPFYDETAVTLPQAGAHVVAIHAHSAGVQTRMLLCRAPVVACDVQLAAAAPAAASAPAPAPLAVTWRCCSLAQWYKPQWSRISSLLGWGECVTVDAEQQGWREVAFDDAAWAAPADVSASCGLQQPVPLAGVCAAATSAAGALPQVAAGTLVERHGYEDDEPAARFRLRRLTTTGGAGGAGGGSAVGVAAERSRPGAGSGSGAGAGAGAGSEPLDYGPAQGLWWRFDAARCQLLRPVLQLAAPAGAVVEICYCQALVDGKASPYHPLCGSRTAYLDRYTVAAAASAAAPLTLVPLEPRGCRYVEVHVVCDDAPAALAQVQLVGATALLRAHGPYHAEPAGAFSCSPAAAGEGEDALCRIWRVGCGSTRSCVEDACIDGPCRERGQWTGDTLAVSLPNLIFLYDDVRPARLCLLQASEAADAHGVVSGNCPEVTYPADYALLWFEGAQRYFEATGDAATLRTLLPRATRCMDFFLSAGNYDPAAGFAPAGY
eukprot:g7610.t1